MTSDPTEAKIRRATPDDQPFLDDMNITAGFGAIRSESDYPDTKAFLDSRPDIAEFSRGFGRDGDVGLIAELSNGEPVGAVWGREYQRTPDDGSLESHPFELTIAVAERVRAMGIGRRLLDTMALLALAEGRSEIVLGVHAKSPARRLYEKAGYQVIKTADGNEATIGHGFIPMIKEIKRPEAK